MYTYTHKGYGMETAILSLRVPHEVKEQLSKMAKATHRFAVFFSSDAIRRYVSLNLGKSQKFNRPSPK